MAHLQQQTIRKHGKKREKMSEKIKIYLERNEYFFLIHELKALLLLHKSLENLNKNGANFEILENLTKARFQIENAKYKKFNAELCENILKALENYEISETNE
jgi:hypothetical protein